MKRVRKTLTADVTLRRLEQFDVKLGQKYIWKTLHADGRKAVQQGEATAGPDGLLTIEQDLPAKTPRLLVGVPTP